MHELRSGRDRIGKALARVGNKMLDLGVDAGFDVGKFIARRAMSCRANASEIVLLFADVAATAIATPVLKGVGL